VVAEEDGDRTAKTVDATRARVKSKHLGPCPAELSQGVVRTTLISLYAQRRRKMVEDHRLSPVWQMRLVPVDVFCLSCQYYRIDGALFRIIPTVVGTAIPKPQ